MNQLSVEVTQSIGKLNQAHSELDKVIFNFRNVSQEINTSSGRFGESQVVFSRYSNEFLQNNYNTINEIQKSLGKAKDVSADYAQKFEIIERGLQDIFAKITTGLKDYQQTVETYLGKYTEALTKTAESLAGASSKQEDILFELTEQLGKLRKN
jgi:methyl-accepting chemotaxis protein